MITVCDHKDHVWTLFDETNQHLRSVFVRTEGPNKFEKLMEAEELVRKSDWAASTSVQRPLSVRAADWQAADWQAADWQAADWQQDM